MSIGRRFDRQRGVTRGLPSKNPDFWRGDRGREEEISLPDALYVITLASLGFQMILCKDASVTVAFVYCPGAQPQSGCEGEKQNSQKAGTSVPGIWQVLGIAVAHVIHNISAGEGAVCLFVNGEIEAEVRQDGCP